LFVAPAEINIFSNAAMRANYFEVGAVTKAYRAIDN
jgi:hypothetical protein